MLKRIIIPLLLILFMASMVAFGAPVYVNVGPTTEFDGDIKILSEIVAEGTTPDDHETTIFFTDPTADRTITVPDFDVTLGTAILLTVTDNENTNETNAVLFTSGGELGGGVLGIESDGDYYYNPSDGSVHATLFYGDGSNLTGVGAAAATALTFTAKEENTSAMVKGQPVYISGAAGAAFPTIGLTDCDDSTKIRIAGLAAEAITQNTTGLVRRAGLLVGVDTLGANAVNPNGEAWAAGDILYVDDTAGGLTNVKPTSGRIVKAAYTLYGSSNTDDLLVVTHENPVYIACAPGEDIDLRMGDEAGVNKVIFEDYADNEVAFVDSDGKADFTSLTLDTALLPAEGGTGVANAANNTITFTGNFTLGVTLTANTAVTLPTSGILVSDATACTDIEGTGLSIAGGVLNWAAPNESIDSDAYVDASIDHEHLHNDVIHGLAAASPLVAADEIMFWDETAGDLRKITWTNFLGTITANKLSVFAATTSAELAGVISDEIGTGDLRFDTSVTAKTGVGTLNVSEAGTIKVSAAAAYTLTLPTAAGNTGLSYHFIKTDANYNLITLDGNGAETFNYENSTSAPVTTYPRLNTYCAEVTIVSDGSNWQVIDEAMGQVPECKAYMTVAQQNILDGTVVLVILDTEEWDIGSNFDLSNWYSGTCTSTSANKLVDTGANFTGNLVGVRVQDTTGTGYTYITAIDSTTQLSVRDDIFAQDDGYEIKNSKFVCPIPGKYMVIGSIAYGSVITDKRYFTRAYKNTTIGWQVGYHSSHTSTIYTQGSGIIPCAINDELTLQAFSTAGTETVEISYGLDKDYGFIQVKLISKD